MNIGRLLNRHAKFRRKHPALIFGKERLTFGSLNSRVNQLANRGDRDVLSIYTFE